MTWRRTRSTLYHLCRWHPTRISVVALKDVPSKRLRHAEGIRQPTASWAVIRTQPGDQGRRLFPSLGLPQFKKDMDKMEQIQWRATFCWKLESHALGREAEGACLFILEEKRCCGEPTGSLHGEWWRALHTGAWWEDKGQQAENFSLDIKKNFLTSRTVKQQVVQSPFLEVFETRQQHSLL